MTDGHGPSRIGSRGSSARCVVWSAQAPPRILIESMRRRGVEPIVRHDAYAAMAEVVVGGSMGAPPGHSLHHPPAPGSNAVLVLVEPARIRGKRAMLTSCRKYASGLRVWVYQARAPIPLRPLDLARLVPPPTDETPATRPEDSLAGQRFKPMPEIARHGLRLAGGGGVQHGSGSADNDDGPGQGGPSGLLSDEELAMLLADDDDD